MRAFRAAFLAHLSRFVFPRRHLSPVELAGALFRQDFRWRRGDRK